MHTITFTCETITPMFLSGADGQTPELRAPSIKGALRFWWRAVNGHLGESLKKREIEIFGGIDGDKGRKSTFSIQILKTPSEQQIGDNLWDIVEHNIPYKGGKPTPTNNTKGVAYLLYSTFMLNSKEYIKPNTEFVFKLIINNPSHTNEIITAMKGLVYFGGLGTRSRRGGGSFWVKNIICSHLLKAKEEELKTIFCKESINNKENLSKQIKEILKIKDSLRNDYSHLKEAKIYIFSPKNITEKSKSKDWINALELIGKPFSKFRESTKHIVDETPNFGFPILHRSTKITMQAGLTVKKANLKKEDLLERRASPIILKLIKVNKDFVFPVIIWLSGELIPANYEIMDKKGGNYASPNNEILSYFFENELENFVHLSL